MRLGINALEVKLEKRPDMRESYKVSRESPTHLNMEAESNASQS
jgi:hypothetical protein